MFDVWNQRFKSVPRILNHSVDIKRPQLDLKSK